MQAKRVSPIVLPDVEIRLSGEEAKILDLISMTNESVPRVVEEFTGTKRAKVYTFCRDLREVLKPLRLQDE